MGCSEHSSDVGMPASRVNIMKLLLLLTFVATVHSLVNDTTPFAMTTTSTSKGRENLTVAILGSLVFNPAINRATLLRTILGSAKYAIAEINSDPNMLPNYLLLPKVYPSLPGWENGSILSTAVSWAENASAYIGPESTCDAEARMAGAFNLPMVTYNCGDHLVVNSEVYPTFARSLRSRTSVTKSVISLLKRYKWNQVALLYYDDGSDLTIIKDTMLKDFEQNSITTLLTVKTGDTRSQSYNPRLLNSRNQYLNVIKQVYLKARILVVVEQTSRILTLLDTMDRLGLLATGEYFVIATLVDAKIAIGTNFINLRGFYPLSPRYYYWLRWFVAFAPTLINATAWNDFRAKVAPYDTSEPYPLTAARSVFQFTEDDGTLYNAVKLYGLALHDHLLLGGDPRNGKAIAQQMINRTFMSSFGYELTIDKNGEVPSNFSVFYRYIEAGNNSNVRSTGIMWKSANASQDVHFFNDSFEFSFVNGIPPLDEPPCGFDYHYCIPITDLRPPIIGGSLGGAVFLILLFGILYYRHWRYQKDLLMTLWKVNFAEIDFTGNQRSMQSVASRLSMVSTASNAIGVHAFTKIGMYRGQVVAVKMLERDHIDITMKLQRELKTLRDMHHDHVVMFIGASLNPPDFCFVTEYCAKGSLADVASNDDIKLDNMFIASLVFDVLRGMSFIHQSDIAVHGNLKSSNCLIDSRWTVKISDFGLRELRGPKNEADINAGELLWTAPEYLRHPHMERKQSGDVYSVAIILFELYGREGPFGECEYDSAEIVSRVKATNEDKPFRPYLGQLEKTPAFVIEAIKLSWDEDPGERPSFAALRNIMKPLQKGLKPNILDNMIALMERYANNLEDIVRERTDLLVAEQKKTETLLYRMLPRSVAEQLKIGRMIDPEAFENVSIYFSDICGFTSLSSESTPWQVVDLLNDLYTMFDSIIDEYDVYKVETIGDAYMVVSGLPKRNGDSHAGEIASMSLHLLDAITKFKIRHRPDDVLKLRIGIHSGSCVTGVVGLKMPRYCLFGDTVNTASRMESNGLPLRIHCSPQCKENLEKLGGYKLEERGLVAMKGKGEILTYWVISDDKDIRLQRMAGFLDEKQREKLKDSTKNYVDLVTSTKPRGK